MDPRLVEFLSDEMNFVTRTAGEFAANMKAGVFGYPIPFFGDIENAVVATIGLNPSATEFTTDRGSRGLSPSDIAAQLVEYFQRNPHPWFAVWERALRSFGASYRTNAVHLDVSPRATISAAAAIDPVAF